MHPATTDRDDSYATTMGSLLAAVALGFALQRSNGTLDATAVAEIVAEWFRPYLP